MKEKQIRTILKNIADNEPNSIKACVANEALQSKNIKSFFNDLAQHGCVSGMISSLIYYHQTHAFFDTYYEEIEEIRIDFEEQTGGPIDIPFGLKNTFAWFAFEQTAFAIASQLELL